MKCIFVDTETGGLDCKVHALLSVGAVVFDPETGEIDDDQFYQVMKPKLAVSPSALAINKLKYEDLMDSYEEYYVWLLFAQWVREQQEISPLHIWAHNADFDFGFISEWEKRQGDTGESKLFISRPSFYCSKQLLRLARLHGHYPSTLSTSQEPACQYFGIEFGNHNALGDAISGARLVCKLWQLFGLAKGEVAE